MPYLNIDLNFGEHPKIVRLRGLLGPLAEAYILRLWIHCGKVHPTDGAMKDYSPVEIEGVIHWSGEPEQAFKAMLKVGLLEPVNKGFRCVDWSQHQGHLAALSRRAKAGAKERWRRYALSNASSNAKDEFLHAPTKPPKPSGQKEQRSGDFSLFSSVDKATAAEDVVLKRRWKYKGTQKDQMIADLPPAYCEWAIKNMVTLEPQDRLGCEIIVKRKQSELHPELRTA